MKNPLDSLSIEIPCPHCGQKVKKTLAWAKANPQFSCRCGHAVQIDGKVLKQQLDLADKALRNLVKPLKR